MQKANIIIQLYTEIKLSLADRLAAQGYAPVHEQDNDPVYGSRFMIWSNNREALRLTWDGKESWFILEITEALPLSTLTPWEEIVVAEFDPHEHTRSDMEQIVQRIVKSLA